MDYDVIYRENVFINLPSMRVSSQFRNDLGRTNNIKNIQLSYSDIIIVIYMTDFVIFVIFL